MSNVEIWSAVIFLCVPALMYLIRDVIEEFKAEDLATHPWRTGDKPRRARKQASGFFSHEVLMIAVCLADMAILKALLK